MRPSALAVASMLVAGVGCSSGGAPETPGPRWGAAALIETEDVGTAVYPQVAFDASGNAIAVWLQTAGAPSEDGGPYDVWASRYTAGSGWGAAQLLETDDAGSAGAPQIAFDGAGNAIAVWAQSDGTRYDIWANRYTAGSGWGAAQLLETDDAGEADAPEVAFDGSGNAIAVWHQSNGTRYDIRANRYTAGSGWGAAQLVETNDAGHAFQPHLAMDASGNAIVGWQQRDAAGLYSTWANRYTAGSGWGAATLIENGAGASYSPQVAMDASGNAIAVWHQSPPEGGTVGIWANFCAGSSWGAPWLVAAGASSSQVAMDASGNAIAVWSQGDGASEDIWANRYAAGSGWGAPGLVAAGAHSPQLAIDASGNAMAVWQRWDGTSENIWANRYTAGSGWGAPAPLETGAGFAHSPQVAMDAGGHAIAVWSQADGTIEHVWANRFE